MLYYPQQEGSPFPSLTKGASFMKYTYTCKKVPLNDSIKEYAEKRLEKLE